METDSERRPRFMSNHCYFLLRVTRRIALSRLSSSPFQPACWLQASRCPKSDAACFPLCAVGFRLRHKSTPITLNPVQVSSIFGNSSVWSTPSDVNYCMHIHTSRCVGLGKHWANKMDTNHLTEQTWFFSFLKDTFKVHTTLYLIEC